MSTNEWVARTLVAVPSMTYTGIVRGDRTMTVYRNLLAGDERQWCYCIGAGAWQRGKSWDQVVRRVTLLVKQADAGQGQEGEAWA